MDPFDIDDDYLDPGGSDFVEDGDRFDTPVPNRRVSKVIRSVAALVLAAMLAAAGTPISWVTILTALLMFLIWIDITSRNHDDSI